MYCHYSTNVPILIVRFPDGLDRPCLRPYARPLAIGFRSATDNGCSAIDEVGAAIEKLSAATDKFSAAIHLASCAIGGSGE